MRHFTGRRPHIVVAGLLVAAAACSDAGTIASPDDGAATLAHTAGAAGDSSTTGVPPSPVAPSTPSDTALTGTPFVPATAIDLAVTVGAAAAGHDTLAYTPLANAVVTVYARKLIPMPGGGADSLTVSESVVATATTDARGAVRFSALPAVPYRVTAVSGLGGGAASVTLGPPYPTNVDVRLIIRPGA